MVSDFHKKNFKLAVYSDESGLYCYAQFDTISTLTQVSCTEILAPETYPTAIKSIHIEYIILCNLKSQEDVKTKLFEHLGKQNASKLTKHEYQLGRIGLNVISLAIKTMNLSLVKEKEQDIASRFVPAV